jgi:glycosyltransferase involved in cell wall biosynthesis
MSPAVSVILPVFDRLKYLKMAIESVLAQDFKDWELIIADDGSGPETQEYLTSLAGRPQLKILRLKHCGVPAAVRNAGLRAATGEFVGFLDSDDIWLPQKLQAQMHALRLNNACLWSYTHFALIDASGRHMVERRTNLQARSQDKVLDSLLREESTVVTPSVVVRRDLLEELGGYDETLRACEDYDLWLRLASRSEASCIDQPLVLVRRHREHSFDDITCLRSMQQILESLQTSDAVPHLAQCITERRMRLSVNLARAYAVQRQRSRMLAVLSASASYSWRHHRWWLGGLEATARAFSPKFALDFGRKWRARPR